MSDTNKLNGQSEKECSTCRKFKRIDDYHVDKSKKDGRKGVCKKCVLIREKVRAVKNKDQKSKYDKEYKILNKERIKSRQHQYYKDNKEHIKEKSKKWRKDNPEKVKENNRRAVKIRRDERPVKLEVKGELTQDFLKSILNYDENTGTLTWKGALKGKGQASNVAGCVDTTGYITIGIGGKTYKAHRIIYLYMEGEIPSQIDHINHIRNDNRFINLRPANDKINSKNKSMLRNNKSGVTGVSWIKAIRKWYASIQIGGKTKSLGRYTDKEDAVAARKKAEIEEGFHINHGI